MAGNAVSPRQASYHDLALFHQDYPEFDGRAVQLDSGPLSVELQELDLDGLVLRQMSSSRRISWEVVGPEHWIGFWLSTPETPGLTCRWQGEEVPAHAVCVVEPGREQLIGVDAGWQDIDLYVKQDLLANVGFDPDEINPSPGQKRQMLNLAPVRARQFAARLRGLLTPPVSARRIDAIQADVLRDGIIDDMIDALERANDRRQPLATLSHSHQYHLVRKAQALADDTALEVLHAQELASLLGTNTRTLQRAFRHVLGTSPYQYLLRKRLSMARSELLGATTRISLNELAARYYFASASEFSRHYKNVYGERPSDSLRASRA